MSNELKAHQFDELLKTIRLTFPYKLLDQQKINSRKCNLHKTKQFFPRKFGKTQQ